MAQLMEKRRQEFKNHLRDLPTTNFRIYTTLVIFVLTSIVYLGMQVAAMAFVATGKISEDYVAWEPAGHWLAFLAVALGIDVAQFGVKRITHKEPPTTP